MQLCISRARVPGLRVLFWLGVRLLFVLKMNAASLVFQIAAQELSDNRVITLSMAGRKLDKKVSGVVSGGCDVKPLPFVG